MQPVASARVEHRRREGGATITPLRPAGPDNVALLSLVAMVHWPADAAIVAYLRAEGRPTLLLVAPDAEVPATSERAEDWIRLPARDEDIRAKAAALEARATRTSPYPEIDDDGRLCFDQRRVFLSPTEEVFVRLLSENFGEVVDIDTLSAALGARRLTANAVRVHLSRLRKRIRTVGLIVHTAHGRGYVLDREVPAAYPTTPRGAPASAPGMNEPVDTATCSAEGKEGASGALNAKTGAMAGRARSLRTVVNVADLEATAAFYRDVLGFDQIGGWDRGRGDQGALIELAEGAVIEIVGHGSGFAVPDYHELVFAIELESRPLVDDVYARLHGAGFDISRPVNQPWGHYSTMLRDPVGTEVVLYAASPRA